MAEGSQHAQHSDIAGILAILTQTVNQQNLILEELRTNQTQLSSLDARMAKLEGMVQGKSPDGPSSSATDLAPNSYANPSGATETVAGPSAPIALAQNDIASVPTTHIVNQPQAYRPPPPANPKGKGKEVAHDDRLGTTGLIQNQHVDTTREASIQSNRLLTPVSLAAGTEKPAAGSSTHLSDDEPIILSMRSTTKRKRRINQPRVVSPFALYGKERQVSVPEPSTSASPAPTLKRKAADTELRSPSLTSRARKLRRVEVLITHDLHTIERMGRAQSVQQALESLKQELRPASPKAVDVYSDAFGSDLSDLSDLTDSDADDGADDTDREDGAMFVERGSEQEVENQVQLASGDDSPARPVQQDIKASRPPRRGIPRPNYDYGDLADLGVALPQDDDMDFVPSKPGNRAPGPSSRPYTTRTQPAGHTHAHPGSSVGISSNQIIHKTKSTSTAKHYCSMPVVRNGPSLGPIPRRENAESGSSKLHASPKPNASKPLNTERTLKIKLPKPVPKVDSKTSPPLRLKSEVKQDKPAMQLIPPAGQRRRLHGYEPFDVTLEPDVRDVLVTRKFMSETYGGSPQPLYPSISEAKRAAMGGHQHRFVFPTLKMNPEVPLIPGHPGLLCRALSTVPWGQDEAKLIVGIGEAMWGYMGNYTTTKSESLSKEEWNSLPEHTKQAWAVDIARRDKYVPLRTRIYLRVEYGREPTEVEVEDQCPLVKSQGPEPTPEQLQQIVDAYSAGHEQIHIWCFKCVGYDADFQCELVEKFPLFVPKKQRAEARARGEGSSAPKSRGRSRKHAASGDDKSNTSRRSLKFESEDKVQAGGSSQVTAVGPPRRAKRLPHKPKTGSKLGLLPSPPGSSQASPPPPVPSQDQEQPRENPQLDVLDGLRELWSAGRDSVIPNDELALALFERRDGMRVLRQEGKITEADYTKLKRFSARHGRGWND